MAVLGASRKRKMFAVLVSGALLVVLFGLVSQISEPTEYPAIFGRFAMVGIAALTLAGVLVLVVQEITRRT